MTHLQKNQGRIGFIVAMTVLLVSFSTSSIGGEHRKGRPSETRSSVNEGSSRAQSINQTPSIRDFVRAVLLARALYRSLAERDRGGAGEGATPHISPTDDWKGQVNTNICNFKHVCQ